MRRTSFWLAQPQIEGLAKAAKEDGLKAAQIMRIALNEYFQRRKNRAGK
jgi:hypothetical protein